jgi:hypothetical protein
MEIRVAKVNNLAVLDEAAFGGEQGAGSQGSGFSVPFIGRSNIWVDNTYTEDVVQLGQFLIMEALRGTYPGELNIYGYDSKLSGLFAPFASLSSGDSKQLTIISSDGGLQDELEHAKQQIQSVHSLIQGRKKALIEFRETAGTMGAAFNLYVLSIDAFLLDRATQVLLSLLMDVGPAAGVSFLIISTTTDAPAAMKAKCSILNVEPGKVSSGGKSASFSAYATEQIIANCAEFADNMKAIDEQPSDGTAADVLRFDEIHDEIHDLSRQWSESSRDELTFTVGRRGQENVSITIGDRKNQRHNALITGAVGQGKSNLISVIIHSLCLRYSPKELSLYLLDYKEGVTLQPFANIGREEYLPHARALGLECDIGFGLAALEHLWGEYKRRLRLFKQANVRDLAEYRRAFPDAEMPRTVVIIDEFQLMFGTDDEQARRIADLLEKSVRLYRAAGIHFILASQSLGGNFALLGKSDVIFSQIPIRIAHKNSVVESMLTLGQDNPEAAYLKPKEAIVNVDYGEISQNRPTTIAFADEKQLADLRKGWWQEAREYAAAPHIFDGEAEITPAVVMRQGATLTVASHPLVALGLSMSLEDTLLSVPLPDESGKNIAIFGASQKREKNNALGIIQGIALSLALWHKEKGVGEAVEKPPLFVFASFMDETLYQVNGMPGFLGFLKSLGVEVEEVDPDDFSGYIKEADVALSERARPTYLFGIGMDRWLWNPELDRYAEPPLKRLLHLGPNSGFHFIGWWNRASDFVAQATGLGEGLDDVGTRIFLQVDKRSVQNLGDQSLLRWTPQDNRALVVDEVELPALTTIIPFVPLTDGELHELIEY